MGRDKCMVTCNGILKEGKERLGKVECVGLMRSKDT